jgi:hypothetical protein
LFSKKSGSQAVICGKMVIGTMLITIMKKNGIYCAGDEGLR